MSAPGKSRFATRAATVAVLISLAAALRVAAALGELYNDEIWSLKFARMMTSPWQALTGIHHDNNHILNTMLLYWIGPDAAPLAYRLFAVATGTASVALLGWISLRRGFREAVTTLLLAGISYPLVLYSSEARGYVPAIFFAAVSFLLIRSWWEDRKDWKLPLLWGSIVLGFLSHLTFGFVYLSLAVWSVFEELRLSGRSKKTLLELVKIHGPPLVFAAVLYGIHVRHIAIGGGADYTIPEVLRGALLLAVGVRTDGTLRTLVLLGVGAAAAWGVVSLRRDERREWIFFAGVLLIAPTLVLAGGRPEYIYIRYLLICFPFLYLALSRCLTWVLEQPRWGKPLYALLLLLFAAGNLPPIADLIVIGRGRYREAVLYLAEQTSGPSIEVGSDHDFRNRLVLDHYARYLPPDKKLSYVTQEEWPDGGPEWLLTHSQDLRHAPARRIRDRQGNVYALERSYPYAGTSGWSWYVYRRAGRPGARG